jgi:hypothetical protein
MPVPEGSPKEIVGEEMHRFKHGELHSGPDKYGHFAKDRKQAIAIALSMARRHGRQMGGHLFSNKPPWSTGAEKSLLHVGPIHGLVAGRTDHVPLKVPNGAYVLPAEHVSHLGQGNTMSGFARLNHMFPHSGHGAPHPPGTPHTSIGPSASSGSILGFKSGGIVHHGHRPEDGVDIMGASGEYVIDPRDVMELGLGNSHHGHEVLDHWVENTKGDQIKTLQKLPGPVKT